VSLLSDNVSRQVTTTARKQPQSQAGGRKRTVDSKSPASTSSTSGTKRSKVKKNGSTKKARKDTSTVAATKTKGIVDSDRINIHSSDGSEEVEVVLKRKLSGAARKRRQREKEERAAEKKSEEDKKRKEARATARAEKRMRDEERYKKIAMRYVANMKEMADRMTGGKWHLIKLFRYHFNICPTHVYLHLSYFYAQDSLMNRRPRFESAAKRNFSAQNIAPKPTNSTLSILLRSSKR